LHTSNPSTIIQHAADVGGDTVFTSSNAFYLSTSWQHILYSALHQSPVMELDTFMPTASVKKAKTIKVDIVCEGGKRWIRHSTLKPLSLLSEFRAAESYVVDDGDSSDDEDGSNAADTDDQRPNLTLDLINSQLAAGLVDGIASQCSLMKLAREMQMAADVAESKSQYGRPIVEIVLTRISLQDMASSLDGKFYDDQEKYRYNARLRAMIAVMEKMHLHVVLREERQLFDDPEKRRHSPSSISSGETANAEYVSRLPCLPSPCAVKGTAPTTTLNLDLSALVALVSHISHASLPEIPSFDEAEKYFLKQHWKTGQPLGEQVDGEEQSDFVDKSQGTQHARALKDQLHREMTTDCFFEAIMRPLKDDQQLNLVCTKEAEQKFFEILSLVGGPTEQKRARHLFEENGQDDFWRGSKWEANKDARWKMVLPVRSVAFNASEVKASSEEGSHFSRLAKRCVQDGLAELRSPIPTPTSHSTGTGIQRQTPHTLASLLFGFVKGHTTLTTNIASVKWLARDIGRYEVAEASSHGYGKDDGISSSSTVSSTSIVLFYPRSLAEKMMTTSPYSAPNVLDDDIHEASVDWNGSTANDDYQHMVKNQPESYLDVKGSANSYGDKTPTVDSNMAAAALALPFLNTTSTPSGSKFGRGYRSTKNWIRGPRPRSTLIIRHFRWWPLRPVEDAWIKWTSRIAWKDPNRANSQIVNSNDEEGQRTSEEDHSLPPLPHSYDDTWWEGVKRDWKLNRLHWTALALTFIAWGFAFAFVVKDLWFEASVVSADGSKQSPTFFDCTTTYWLGNAQCGLDGQTCSPYSYPTSVPFRCPASCETTTLGGARAVGDQLPSFVTLVVGGGPSGNSTSVESSLQTDTGPFMYRGDSFVCSAAIHAGVITSGKGGCGNLWLNGAYSGYQGVERNGIQSTSFNSSFPISYYFDTQGVHGEKCTDRRYRGYVLDVILLAWTGFILQPKNIVYYFTLVVVGFWHVNFISEPREFPMSIGDPIGDFLPTLFVAYAYWRLVFRYLWPAFESLPLERNVWIQGFYWLGVLLDVVFVNVPLSRLVISDLTSQPGALTSLIIIIVVVVILAINQVRVIRKVGKLPKFLTLSIIGGIIIGLLAAIPTTGLRLHHYIIAMVLLLYCSFATRLSLIYGAFLLGMFLNGAGRWGYDGLIQDVATIVGTGLSGSAVPVFLAASNWTGVPNQGGPASSDGIVHWQGITPNLTDSWDSYQLLVDDVLRLQSIQTSFNMSLISQYYLNNAGDSTNSLSSSLLPASNLSYYPVGNDSSQVNALIAQQPHYLRLAYFNSNSGNSGDFTKAATVFFNGTFISPAGGST
jgi:hypothetical protein